LFGFFWFSWGAIPVAIQDICFVFQAAAVAIARGNFSIGIEVFILNSDFKNSGAEANVSRLRPTERINRISALRIMGMTAPLLPFTPGTPRRSSQKDWVLGRERSLIF
jgi:hypothetical protein